MTKEQFKKLSFVTQELDQLVKAINPDIHHITYIEQNGIETVEINFKSSCIKRVDVTADSLLAITKDVLKHI